MRRHKLRVAASGASPRRQRGAVGIMAAAVLGLLIVVMALAVDTARLYSERRALQSAADLAVIAGVNASGFCGYDSGVSTAEIRKAIESALLENNFDISNEKNRLESVELGRISTVDGLRSFNADSSPADTVQVFLTKEVRKSLVAGGVFGETLTLQAKAAATRQSKAAFSVGSYTARVDLNQSVLNPLLSGLLGTDVALSLLDYRSLADANVSLGAIADSAEALLGLDLTAGNMEALLETELSALQFIELLASAVRLDGLGSAEVALGDLAAISGSSDARLQLGDILRLGPATEDKPAARLNLLDLITAGLMAGRTGETVSFELSGLHLPILNASPTVKLYIGSPPQFAYGPAGKEGDQWRTQAYNAQTRVQLHLPLDLNLLELVRVQTELGLVADIGAGWAALQGLECGRYPQHMNTVHMAAASSPLSLALGKLTSLEAGMPTIEPLRALRLQLLGDDVATASLGLSTGTIDSASNDAVFTVAFDELAPGPKHQRIQTPVSASLSNLVAGLGDDLTIDVELLEGSRTQLLNLLLGLVIGTVESTLEIALREVLAATIDTVGAALLDPLLDALGVDLAGVDVTLYSLEAKDTELTYIE